MDIAFISSYVPRKCGIATYTKDLVTEALSQGHKVFVLAMENPLTPNIYSHPVTQTIKQDNLNDYIDAARKINGSSAEIVHLQHEFGLFGGKDGDYILSLARELNKPLIVTFHTVLLTPSPSQKANIQELARIAGKVIVMDKIGKDRLETVYGLNTPDITIILHGAPIITKTNPETAKKEIGYQSSYILLANNLLSRNKGIEYAIDAVGKVLDQIPNLTFLIVGETHPMVKVEEGESYRNELISRVKKLGLEKNVIFINEYVSLEKLKLILSAADIYITPYLDPQQTSSGTLSYAIGAGKACIATEYVYARGMLSGDKGVLVPFRDSDSIAQALIMLYKDPDKKNRIETLVSAFSSEMGWPRVFQKHCAVYKKIQEVQKNISQRAEDFIHSPINSTHLANMTNKNGIVQHANTNFPDLKFGYSTCDNARALIVASQLHSTHKSDEFLRLVRIYSSFLDEASEKNGKFHTFRDSDLKWSDQEGVTDAFGRVVWGLGFHLYAVPGSPVEQPVKTMFEKSMFRMKDVVDLRNASYCILGLYYYILAYQGNAQKKKAAVKLLMQLGRFIKAAFVKNRGESWDWFEKTITYDNFRIPQSLFAIFLVTNDASYKDIAKRSLNFITDCNFNREKNYFDFIGQNGWYKQGELKANYDQQPLEAAGAVEANIFALKALQDPLYLTQANLAYEWFFGNNRNHTSMYDQNSKGVYDGLTPRGVNVNQGAESIVCFLISSLLLKECRQDLLNPDSSYQNNKKRLSFTQNRMDQTYAKLNLQKI